MYLLYGAVTFGGRLTRIEIPHTTLGVGSTVGGSFFASFACSGGPRGQQQRPTPPTPNAQVFKGIVECPLRSHSIGNPLR